MNIAAIKYIAATVTYITWKYSISNGINIFIAIYNIFKIIDNVNAYTDILNIATYLIFIFATHAVNSPNILSSAAFHAVSMNCIINTYMNIARNILTYNDIIFEL